MARRIQEFASHREAVRCVNWHERYRLGAAGGGKPVEDDALAEAVAGVARANGGEKITVFEILTAVTFVLSSEHPADAAIIEVGLGGRLDATNVVANPAVSVIMPISIDHAAYLGDRVELIAAEKAGVPCSALHKRVHDGRPTANSLRGRVSETHARTSRRPKTCNEPDSAVSSERPHDPYRGGQGLSNDGCCI